MSVKIGHASIDENGKASGGAAGDQTGKEVCTREWYNKGWNKVIRPKSSVVAEKMAAAMEAACANDNIGYDQNERTTLYTQAKAKNWNISAIQTKCECDCSSLIAVCANAASITVCKDIYTGNEAAALKNTGEFDVYTDSKYLTQDNYLKRGDILLKEGSHTAIALENGSAVSSGNSGNSNNASGSAEVYTVQRGDTLSKIASKYGITYQSLASYNGIANPNAISVGQQIKIPGSGTKTYTVKAGDSLWAIAASQLGNGSRYNEIQTMNGLKNDTIHAGQVLKMPTK